MTKNLNYVTKLIILFLDFKINVVFITCCVLRDMIKSQWNTELFYERVKICCS